MVSLFLSRYMYKLSYAIGVAEPLAINVNAHGTETRPITELEEIVKKNFDLRPGVIIRYVAFACTVACGLCH